MVWIHGGAFMRGSSGIEMYGPDFLLQKDVILISFNYRLGVFGMVHIHISYQFKCLLKEDWVIR